MIVWYSYPAFQTVIHTLDICYSMWLSVWYAYPAYQSASHTLVLVILCG